MTDYDAVVVGGRVAGAATALLLARAGLRVVVVERGRPGGDTVSTHAFMRAGVLQLSRWGLLEAVEKAGTPPVRRTMFHYPGLEPVTVTIRSRGGVDALYAPRRFVLDEILLDAAQDAGAEVVRGTVTEVLHDLGGRVVGVRLIEPGGSERRLRARHTIGADGIASVVARQVGAEILQAGRHASAMLYRYYDALPTGGYEWFYSPGAAAGLIPTNAGQTCVFVGTTPLAMRKRRRNGTEAGFSDLVRDVGRPLAGPSLADRMLDARPAGRLHGWAGHPGFLRQAHGAGWALVGDAGYYKDPITTHGMTDALRDAQLLTDAVLAATSGRSHERVAMARYQSTRDRLSQRLLEATEAVAGYGWDTPTIQRLLREVSASMSDELEYLDSTGDAAVSGVITADNADPALVPSRAPREGPAGGRRVPR
ncbi:MAG: FAD-dependent oxidoreductase [Nocardioides sp.]